MLGSDGDGLAYAFWVSETGTRVFAHKQLAGLQGLLNRATTPTDVGPHYLGCHFEDFTCRRLLDTHAHPTDVVAKFGAELLDACRPLHQNQLFHGCLSPGRIVLSDTLELIIRDCGIISAILLQPDQPFTIQTPGFERVFAPNSTIPPEVLRGGTCTSETDIFLIGSMLYRLLTAQDPFAAKTALGRYRRIADGDYVPLGAEVGELRSWIHNSLAPCPSNRPSPEESRTLFASLRQSSSLEPLFDPTTTDFSSTLSARKERVLGKPFLASDHERLTALASLEGNIQSRPNLQRRGRKTSGQWGSWLAVLCIAGLTWIFIELAHSEMRTRNYDGRPGPARQESRSARPPEVSYGSKKSPRRRPEKGSRLPRRAIVH